MRKLLVFFKGGPQGHVQMEFKAEKIAQTPMGPGVFSLELKGPQGEVLGQFRSEEYVGWCWREAWE